MDEKPKENWGSTGPYERYVGRWSRQVAAEFVHWISLPAGSEWADIGCGTGALVECILARCEPKSIAAVDRAEGFVSAARRNVTDPRASFDTADAKRYLGTTLRLVWPCPGWCLTLCQTKKPWRVRWRALPNLVGRWLCMCGTMGVGWR